MSISQRKIEANRANARRSTGPRTPRGKRAASRNALAHGLTGRAALLPGDDPEEYRRFVHAVLQELDPHGPMQEELVGEIANLSWKLRRAPGAEAILLARKHLQGREEPDEVIVNMILDRSYKNDPRSPLWLLVRYTHNIVRERAQALRMLLALKKQEKASEEIEETETDADSAIGENSLVQNEATAAGEGDRGQPLEPHADAAGGAPPIGESGPSSEANFETL
jgi:hypothetical protein